MGGVSATASAWTLHSSLQQRFGNRLKNNIPTAHFIFPFGFLSFFFLFFFFVVFCPFNFLNYYWKFLFQQQCFFSLKLFFFPSLAPTAWALEINNRKKKKNLKKNYRTFNLGGGYGALEGKKRKKNYGKTK